MFKPRIKTKQLSNSETMFPELYKKRDVVHDNFSKIYLTNLKIIKENDPLCEEGNFFSKEKLRNMKNITAVNNFDHLKNKYEEYLLTTAAPDVFSKEKMNNRFMYSYKSNKTKKSFFNGSTKSSFNSHERDKEKECREKNMNDNLRYFSNDNVKIYENYEAPFH